MDYSFLENIPSSLSQIPSYEPDFNFLSTMQGKANQQYEAGLSQVKSEYGAIFSQPVTGVAMQQRQQEYAKQAQQRMKDINASDLTDPKNVQAAEQVMAPFHEDGLLMKNIGLTANYQSEKGKIDAMRNSKDKDQRELFNNPILDNYINNGIEQLADAPLTQDAYSQLSLREATPIYDAQADGDKEFAALYGKDGGIKTTDANGAIMSISTGGPQSVAGYRAFISEVMQRPKYAIQNRLIATTLMEDDIKDLKRNNPGITEPQVKQLYAQKTIGQVTNYYAQGIIYNRKAALEARMRNSSIFKLDVNGNPIPNSQGKIIPEGGSAGQAQAMANTEEAKKYERLAGQLEQEFSSGYGFKPTEVTKTATDPNILIANVNINSEQYKKSFGDITGNPQDYVQKVYLGQQIDKWANAKASISSTEYKENPAYKAYTEQANKDWEHKLALLNAQSNAGYKAGKLTIEQAAELRKEGVNIPLDMIITTSSDNPFGEGFNASSGFGQASSYSGLTPHTGIGSGEVGQPGTDIQKVPTLDIFQREQQDKLNASIAHGLTYEGNLQLFNTDNIPGGLSVPDLMDMSGQLQKATTTGKYPNDESSIKVRTDFMDLLKSQGVITGDEYNINAGPGVVRAYSERLATKYATDLKENADPIKRQLGMQIMEQQQEVENGLAEYGKQQDAYKQQVANFLKSHNTNGEYNKILHEGKPITAADMTGDFKSLTLVPKSHGMFGAVTPKDEDKLTLEPAQLADLYRNGKLEFDVMKGGVKVDGKHYDIWGFDGKDADTYQYKNVYGSNMANTYQYPDAFAVKMLTDLDSKYGSSKEMKKKLDNIGDNVIPNIPGYSTGLSGSAVSYNMAVEEGNKDPKVAAQRNTAVEVTQELLRNPINFNDIYTTDGTNKKDVSIPEDEKRALMEGSNRKDIFNLFGQAQYFPHGPNGKPAWKLSAASDSKGDKDRATIGGTDIKSLKGHGAIWIDIADNAKGDYLSQLPHPTSLYKYGRVYYDKNPITQSPFEEQSGFRYQIVPDPTKVDGSGRFTRAIMVTQKQAVDAQTGILQKDKEGKPIWAPQMQKSIDLTQYNPDMLMEAKNAWILGSMQENDLLRSSHQVTAQDNGIDMTNYYK